MVSKEILKNSLFQLLLAYSVLLLLFSAGFFSRYALHFELFALLVAIVGVFAFWKQKEKTPKFEKESKAWLFLLALSFAILFFSRAIPLLSSAVPLGYDFGIYKFAFEQHALAFPNIYSAAIPHWVGLWSPLGIYLVSDLISLTGLTAGEFLNPLIVFFELFLGLAVFLCAREYFGKKAAALSVFFYSVSIIQFKAFELFYLKNIFGLALLLLALYFLKKKNFFGIVLPAGFLAGVHRPTFLVFAIAFAVHFLANLKEWRKNLLAGFGILLFVVFFYWNSFQEAILGFLLPAVESPSPGTFINFFTFQFSTLFYLPFALFGLFLLLRQKKHPEFSIAALFLLAITAFELLFYNRYLIQLDIFLILLAGFGFQSILQIDSKKIWKLSIIGLVLIASIVSLSVTVQQARPLISGQELEFIKKIPELTEPNASILVTSSYYSPWVLGFSKRKAIMPGLFESDRWNLKEWRVFWDSNSAEQAVEMLSGYEKPLYVFNGEFARINREKFRQPCFETVAS